jgi:hypothetical protein
MTITVLGEVPISAVNPASVGLSAAVTASVAPSVSNLTAQLDGLFAAQLDLVLNPPNLLTMLAQAQALVASIEAALATSLPSVDVQLLAVLAAIAELQSSIGQLQATLDLAAAIPLGTSVHAVVFRGRLSDFGAQVGAHFSGGIQGSGGDADAVVLCIGAVQPASRVAMQAVFGVG